MNASPGESASLRNLLATGRIAAIPTDTFYGLAADPSNGDGVRRVFEAKGRQERKPLPVLFATREQLDGLGVTAPEDVLDRYFHIWPAPLTVILPLTKPIPASQGRSSLAVRIPDARDLVLLLEAVGAVTATSANRAGAPPLADPGEVAEAFEGYVDLLVDGGRTPGEKPSTLLDATVDPPAVLRPGAFPWPC